MKSSTRIFAACTFILALISCNHVTYIPKSRTSIRREKPSVLLLESIVDFRLAQNSWPVSTTDFTGKGIKYYKAFENFPYTDVQFKTIDSNTMIFYFSGHITDVDDYNRYRKINLNTYNGNVKFFKEKDRFVWKLKMN